MSVAILGSTGRLGRILHAAWPEARFFGRSASARDIQGCTALIDLRGVVNGQGNLSLNVNIARQALDLAQEAQIAHVFLPSSAAVYGRLGADLTEDQAAPIAPYGKAKLEMEQMAAGHAQPATCLRIANVAGVDAILGGWRPGFTLDQMPDGRTPLRSYIGPQSFARVLQALAALPDLPPVLNLTSPALLAMDALLDAADLPWTPRPPSDHTIPCVALNTQRLETYVSFAPNECSAQGIVAQWREMKDAL